MRWIPDIRRLFLPSGGFRDDGHGVMRTWINRAPTVGDGGMTGKHNPMGKGTLGEIIRWFKGRIAFEIHQNHPCKFAWQRLYHDRIIRNQDELNHIRRYIRDNPRKGDLENFHE